MTEKKENAITANEQTSHIEYKILRLIKISYSVDQIVKRTSICKNTIYDALKDGSLVGRKCGKRTIVMHDDLMLWLVRMPRYETKTSA